MANPEQDSTFFNVMPEASGIKPVKPLTEKNVNSAGADKIFGTAKAAPTVLSVSGTKKHSFFLTWKFLIPAVIILLGVLGFIVWNFIGSDNKDNAIEDTTPIEQSPVDADTTTPAEWLARFFGSETCTVTTTCGDTADPDRDGLTNKEEYETGTGVRS